MGRTITQIQNSLIDNLVAYAATLGITINPNDWVYVPGNISETDYKLLLLNTVASGEAFNEQVQDLFLIQSESLIASAQPQTGAWFRFQMLMFQFNSTTPQIPQIQPSTTSAPLSIIWNPVNPSYRVIAFCSVIYGSAGRCIIKVAAISGGLPVDLETAYPGSLAAALSFVNLIAAPGISYTVQSGNSDWLFLQIDLYYIGVYSAVIFNSVSNAITAFLNTIPFNGVFKLSSLEEAILAVAGVDDLDFINVAARPDYNSLSGGTTTSFGTILQEFLVSNGTENSREYQTNAGYIAVENGTSSGTPSPVPNSKLSDYRVGSSGVLNLNCIAI